MVYRNASSFLAWLASGSELEGITAPTSGWPLVDFEGALGVLVAYALGVACLVGYMRRDPEFKAELPTVALLYNMTQVVLCGYMTLESVMVASRHNYTWICNKIQPDAPMAKLLWLFHLSKVLDLVDTVFIVLGRRWRQLTFLHLYHHSSIFAFYWINVNVNYDGDIYLTVLLNSFVHCVMYMYYVVALHTRAVWWKKWLTRMQMIQFAIMICQSSYLLNAGASCTNVPPAVVAAYGLYIGSMLGLFLRFYLISY